MIWKRRLARIGGNFGTTFLTVFLTFNFVTGSPTIKLIVGAFLTASVIAAISFCYELQKYAERVR